MVSVAIVLLYFTSCKHFLCFALLFVFRPYNRWSASLPPLSYNQPIWQYTYTLPTHILELKLCICIVLLILALVCLWGFAQPPESPSVPLWSLVSVPPWSLVPLTQAQTSWDTEPDFNTLKEMDIEVETYKQYAIKWKIYCPWTCTKVFTLKLFGIIWI